MLASRRADLKSATGHPLDEATDPNANPANTKGSHFYRAVGSSRSKAAPPQVDWSLRAQQQEEKRWRESNPDADTSGYFWPVERVDRKN